MRGAQKEGWGLGWARGDPGDDAGGLPGRSRHRPHGSTKAPRPQAFPATAPGSGIQRDRAGQTAAQQQPRVKGRQPGRGRLPRPRSDDTGQRSREGAAGSVVTSGQPPQVSPGRQPRKPAPCEGSVPHPGPPAGRGSRVDVSVPGAQGLLANTGLGRQPESLPGSPAKPGAPGRPGVCSPSCGEAPPPNSPAQPWGLRSP